MVISIFGFIFSAIIHLCIIFNNYNPPREVIILIHIGLVVVIYPALLITKKVRGKINVKDFNNTILTACPKWLSVMLGVLIGYTLIGFIYFIFNRYSGSMVPLEEKVVDDSFQGFSGYWMALYSLAFTMMYCCRKLVKSDMKES